ncbi:hypothetical protein ACFVIM_01460 [Streptomyces sp. NPDC057638]|uniref:hypothetical protein n=1 Tax=Streptomyces sp. NPDC057638 TaxID=3346190 RepID=UPI0036C0C4F1
MTKNHARKSAARARASMTGQPYTVAGLRSVPDLVVMRQFGDDGPGCLTLVVTNWTAPGNRSLTGVAPGAVYQWPSSAQLGRPCADPFWHMIEHGWADGADPAIGEAQWGVVFATPDGTLNGIAWDDCLLYAETLHLTPTNHAALASAPDGLVRVVVTKTEQPLDRSMGTGLVVHPAARRQGAVPDLRIPLPAARVRGARQQPPSQWCRSGLPRVGVRAPVDERLGVARPLPGYGLGL